MVASAIRQGQHPSHHYSIRQGEQSPALLGVSDHVLGKRCMLEPKRLRTMHSYYDDSFANRVAVRNPYRPITASELERYRIGTESEPPRRQDRGGLGIASASRRSRIGTSSAQHRNRSEPHRRRIVISSEPQPNRLGSATEPRRRRIGATSEPRRNRGGASSEPSRRRLGTHIRCDAAAIPTRFLAVSGAFRSCRGT